MKPPKGTKFSSDIPESRLLLRGTEVAELLGICKAMAYRMMANGTLPTVRFGEKAIRVPRSALQEWIRINTKGGEA